MSLQLLTFLICNYPRVSSQYLRCSLTMTVVHLRQIQITVHVLERHTHQYKFCQDLRVQHHSEMGVCLAQSLVQRADHKTKIRNPPGEGNWSNWPFSSLGLGFQSLFEQLQPALTPLLRNVLLLFDSLLITFGIMGSYFHPRAPKSSVHCPWSQRAI